MDADRVNEVLAIHGAEITDESHLRAVALLATWPADDIVDYHDSLLALVAQGAYASAAEEISFEGVLRLPWEPGLVAAVRRNLGEDEKKAAKRLREWASQGSTGYHDVGDLIREAPWAYRRATGEFIKHTRPEYTEELRDAGSMSTFVVTTRVSLESDLAEIVSVTQSPSEALAVDQIGESTRYVARRAGVKVLGVEVERIAPWPIENLNVLRQRVVERDYSQNAASAAVYEFLMAKSSSTVAYPRLGDDEFWSIVSTGDMINEESFEIIGRRLSNKSKAVITSFQETLAAKLYELDRPEFCPPEAGGDVFLYLRCAVVAMGRDEFSRVLNGESPVSEDESVGGIGELLLYVAQEAWDEKYVDAFDHESSLSWETGSNIAAWGWMAREVEPDAPQRVGVRSRARNMDGELIETISFWNERLGMVDHYLAIQERSHWGRKNYLGISEILPLPEDKDMTPMVAAARICFVVAR